MPLSKNAPQYTGITFGEYSCQGAVDAQAIQRRSNFLVECHAGTAIADIEAMFEFETETGRGEGVVRLVSDDASDLRAWVLALPDFDDDPEHSGEKILEAIQMAWIEERE